MPVTPQLQWPRDLFVQEATLLLEGVVDGSQADAAELLREAFVSSEPHDTFMADSVTGWQYLRKLVNDADSLPEAPISGGYFSQREGVASAALSFESATKAFIALVDELEELGYLANSFGKECPDARSPAPKDRNLLLELRLGQSNLWPLWSSRGDWDESAFLDVIEVFHDLVARPRHRRWHGYMGCEWDWSNFAATPGQRLYRWRVNRLLDRTEVPYRVAESGEDVGHVVAVMPDVRSELIDAMVARTDAGSGDRVRHAVALFRCRGATADDRRSAILALAGVLEERRALIKEHLFTKDEGALFQIANNFGLRHQGAAQQDDYEPLFLDWIFWWYLATVELTDRLLQR